MKKIWSCIAGVCIFLLLAGCSVKISNMDKIKDLEYTVVEKEKAPEELENMIAEQKKESFQLTFSDKGYLYIAKGYGGKETSGYSIEVVECYETEDAVYIHTNLVGPAKDEQVAESTTYPYVVLKLGAIEKNVVFE